MSRADRIERRKRRREARAAYSTAMEEVSDYMEANPDATAEEVQAAVENQFRGRHSSGSLWLALLLQFLPIIVKLFFPDED